MKKIIIFSVGMLLSFFTVTVSAQTLADSLKYVDHIWTLKKKAAVLKHIGLSEAEKSSFWPVFNSFQRATCNYEMQSVLLISRYAREGSEFSQKELYEFSTKVLKNDLELARLRKKYYKRFRHAVSPEQASAFMQLDENFRNIMRMEAQKNLIFGSEEVYSRN